MGIALGLLYLPIKPRLARDKAGVGPWLSEHIWFTCLTVVCSTGAIQTISVAVGAGVELGIHESQVWAGGLAQVIGEVQELTQIAPGTLGVVGSNTGETVRMAIQTYRVITRNSFVLIPRTDD